MFERFGFRFAGSRETFIPLCLLVADLTRVLEEYDGRDHQNKLKAEVGWEPSKYRRRVNAEEGNLLNARKQKENRQLISKLRFDFEGF